MPRTGDELKRVKKAAREKSVEEIEKQFVLEALKRNEWNVTKSAEETGMQRPNFQALMKKYHIRVSRNTDIAEDVERWRAPGESARWRSTTGCAVASGRAPRGWKPSGRGGALSRAEFFLLPDSRSSMRKP